MYPKVQIGVFGVWIHCRRFTQIESRLLSRMVNFEFQLETQRLRTTARLKSFNLFGIFRVKTLTTLPTPVENERRSRTVFSICDVKHTVMYKNDVCTKSSNL